jgi:hypothetical protein
MNSTNEQRSLLSTSGRVAAVLLVVAGLIYVAGGPLKTARPISEEEIVTPALSDEWVQARLWQDPFLAVQQTIDEYEPEGIDEKLKHFSKLPPPTDGISAAGESDQTQFTTSLQRRCAKAGIKVLGVMVFGGAYHEQIEGRIRARYATLSALAQLQYAPVDPEHIGTVVVPQRSREDRLPLIIPYEWFRAENGDGPTTLLVLWLLDEPFGYDHTPNVYKPFTKLAELLDMLKKAAKNGNQSCVDNKHVSITGPAGSNTLRAMVKEAMDEDPNEGDCLEDDHSLSCHLAELTIVSPSATAAGQDWLSLEREPPKHLDCESIVDHDLLQALCIQGKPLGPKHAHDNIAQLLRERLKVNFRSTIGTDPVLMKSLVDELARRGVDLGKDHIAVVSEWDTYYGRALPIGLKAIVEDKEKEFQTKDTFHQFSYMRGIDGRITGRENGKGGNGNGTESPADSRQVLPEAETGLQHPSGRSQIDYLERLATRLKELDAQIKIDRGMGDWRLLQSGGLRAIGVLGSDVYDKLLVVQALRPRFRDAIFFTTDLDAGLWHPDELRFTRNMIVSSNYGLELAQRHYKMGLPPFRDNYQTSRYLATLVALDPKHADYWEENHGSTEPRIFEIGRRGPVDLSRDDDPLNSCAPTDSIDSSVSSRSLYPCPRVRHLWSPKQNIYLLAAFLLGVGFLLLYSKNYRRFPTERDRPPVLAIAALPVILFAVVALFQGSEGEPLTVLDGVSIWPAEAIRLMAGALATYLLISACRQVQKSDAKLEKLYKGKGSTAEHLRTYKTASEPRQRLRRAAGLSMLYLLFSIAVLNALGFPNVPDRGRPFSLAVHIVVTLGFSVIPLLLLLFFVLDATNLTSWLTHALSTTEANWDEDSSARSRTKKIESGEVVAMPADWTTVNFIATQTETVGRQVYYPTIVMMLMFASRASFFDNWALSPGLLLVGLIALGYVIFCALRLRRAAEDARSNALERLEDSILDEKRMGDKKETDVLQFVQQDIKAMARGAFVPIPQQPWLRTLLLLFGGGGSFLLLEYVAWLR